jgi:hypothetical protein
MDARGETAMVEEVWEKGFAPSPAIIGQNGAQSQGFLGQLRRARLTIQG